MASKKGKTRTRVQRNVRANQNNLTVDEKIVRNLCKLHGVSTKKGWEMYKQRLMFKELPV